MKLPSHLTCRGILATAITSSLFLSYAHAANITWDAGGGADKNWSTVSNWSDNAAATGDDVTFNATGALASGTTNTVDASISIASLTYNLESSTLKQTTSIAAGQTLTVAGNFLLAPSINASTTAKTDVIITGATGALIVNGTSFQVGQTANSTFSQPSHSLDMSGLGTLTANLGSSGIFRMNSAAGTVTGPSTTVVKLAANSTITANVIGVGDTTGKGATYTLKLGSTANTLNANTISIGQSAGGRSSGELSFETGTGTLKLRAADGTSAVTAMNLINSSLIGTANFIATANFAGHDVDANITTLTMGRRTGAGTLASANSTFTFDTGILEVGTLNLGEIANATYNSGTINAIMNIGGGTATFGAINMATSTSAAGTTINSTLNFTGGNTTVNGNILKGGGGSGTTTANLNLNGAAAILDMTSGNLTGLNTITYTDGLLKNLSVVNTGMTLAGTGSRVFDQATGVSGEIQGAITGSGVGLTKQGVGSLTLTGANTYTGTTTISGGILSINGTSALQGTSGVTIAGGAGLTYTGGAATFGKNITVTAGSGTGTIRNSGGLLTLSGNLSKDNSVLRLTGGAFNVTGTISGATAGTSDLLVDGTSSVTLSAANTYNGPTFVIESSTLAFGINNAIPANSVVTLGNASSQGTLSMSGYTGEIGGLAFGSAGGTLRLAATSTSAAPLTASSGTMTLTNGTLDLAGSGTTAGLYRVLSAQSVAGAFANITGTSAAYQVITSATSVDYQQRAVFGAVSVTNPVVSIITGGSAAFTYTVANSALSGGASLGFTAAGLSNVAGSSSGTATAGGSSGAISGLVFTGTSVGSGQTGGFTVNAPTAFGATTATGTVAVTVLDHALPGFLAAGIADPYTSGTLNIDFGSIDESAGVQNFTYSLLNLASQTYGAGLTAGLDFTGVTADGDGFASGLTTFNNLVGGGTSSLFTFTFTPSGQGSFNKQFTLSFSDNQNLSGASTRRDLTIVGNVIVVPEPGAIALAGVGIALVCWTAARRTCRSAR